MDPLATLSLVFLAIALVPVVMGVRSVPRGYAYTVERFGRWVRTLGPGLDLFVPFVERVGAELDVTRPRWATRGWPVRVDERARRDPGAGGCGCVAGRSRSSPPRSRLDPIRPEP
jgi:regulator of protease activity HflC (stomatin/prohibitin superfamily)